MKRLVSAKTKTIFETASEVFDRGQHRQVIVEAHPMYAIIRLKRQKRSYCISWETVWRLGADAFVQQLRKDRLAEKRKNNFSLISPNKGATARSAAAKRARDLKRLAR
jgi:hypothetical protein